MQECEAQVVARDEQFVPGCFCIGWKAHCFLQWKHGIDEDAFIEKSRFSLALTREHLAIGNPPVLKDSPIKIVTAFRCHPSTEKALLVSTVCDEMTKAIAEDAPLAQRVLVTDHEAHTGQPPAVFDIALMSWFPDLEKAQSHLSSANRARAELALAGIAFGRFDLLAKEVHVIKQDQEK